MPMLWQSQAGPAVRESVRRAKMKAESIRMLEAGRRLDMLEDDWKDVLLEKLNDIYQSKKVRQSLPSLLTTEHNVLKRIGKELSTVYKWGTTRELERPADQKIADVLWEECRIDEQLGRANLYTNVLRDVLIWPRIVAGKMKLDFLLPDRTTVQQHDEDPTQAVALWTDRALPNTLGYLGFQRIYMDVETIRIYDQYGKTISEKAHATPGRLPVVVVHAEERVDFFWGGSAFSDVYDANMSVACDLVKLGRMLKFQSELQPAYSGQARDVAKGQTIGGDSLWAGPGQWSVLNLQGDPAALLSTIKARIGWIAECYGLASDVYDLSATATSGFQIRLKRLPLMEARRTQIKTWKRIERELLTLMALVSQVDHPLRKLDPMAEYKLLDHHEEPMIEDPRTQNSVFESRIAMAQMSEVDVAMELNPDLSREQALELVKRVISERELVIPMLKRLGTSGKVGEPGQTQQQNGADGAAAKGGDGTPADLAEIESAPPARAP